MILFIPSNTFWKVGKLYDFGEKMLRNSWRCSNYFYTINISYDYASHQTELKFLKYMHALYTRRPERMKISLFDKSNNFKFGYIYRK